MFWKVEEQLLSSLPRVFRDQLDLNGSQLGCRLYPPRLAHFFLRILPSVKRTFCVRGQRDKAHYCVYSSERLTLPKFKWIVCDAERSLQLSDFVFSVQSGLQWPGNEVETVRRTDARYTVAVVNRRL